MRPVWTAPFAALTVAVLLPLHGAGPNTAALRDLRFAVDDSALSTLRLQATLAGGGPTLGRDLRWTLTEEASGRLVAEDEAAALETRLPAGRYVAEATWAGSSDGLTKSGRAVLEIEPSSTVVREIGVDLGLSATLEAPASVREGDLMGAAWDAPEGLAVRIDLARPGDRVSAALGSFDTDGASGALRLQAPSAPGFYEVRLVLADPGVVLARSPLEVVAYDYALETPPEAEAGRPIVVAWRGPGHPGDQITLLPAGDGRALDPERAVPARSNPAELMAPIEPGSYEIRYVSADRLVKAVGEIEILGEPESF